MKYEELIRHFGSNTNAANALGMKRQNVWKWKKAGQIPIVSQYHIETKTGGALKVDSPILKKKSTISGKYSTSMLTDEEKEMAEKADKHLEEFVNNLNEISMSYNVEIIPSPRGGILVMRKHDIFSDYAYKLKRSAPRMFRGKLELGVLINSDMEILNE